MVTLTTVVNSGPSDNRVDIVFLGDGYTAEELAAAYRLHVDSFLEYLFGGTALTDPFNRYVNFFNVHLANIASNESGADDPTAGVERDTALDASYLGDGQTQRLLTVGSSAYSMLNLALSGTDIDPEMRLVVVNDTQYGGSGGYFAVFAGGNGSAYEVALHELGHSFAGLADEYTYGGQGPYSGPEHYAANLTIDPTGARWSEWLGYVDPILGEVGAYEGGAYVEEGIYRPTENSKMRSLNRPFDPIAREEFILKFYNFVDPLDSWDDATGTQRNLTSLSVDVIDPEIILVDWTINGQLYEDAGEYIALNADTFGWGEFTIVARAYDPTEWVRGDRSSLEQSITWTIVNDYLLTGTSEAETLEGNDNAQTIRGLGGGDSIFALAGDDSLFGGASGDLLDGGAGFDFARYDDASAGVVANLKAPEVNTGEAAGDTYVAIEGLVGSAHTDTLVGDDSSNQVYGLAGNDVIYGLDGADVLSGDDGADHLYGGLGGDALIGGAGFDYAHYDIAAAGLTAHLALPELNTGEAAGDSYNGIEGLVGTSYADILAGDAGDNWIYGGDGYDQIYGAEGNDFLFAYLGPLNFMWGGLGADVMTGGLGLDFARYDYAATGVVANLGAPGGNAGEAAGDQYNNIEGLVGSTFGDTLVGDGSNNEIYGIAGDDWVYGQAGNDFVFGDAGNDHLEGGAGADYINGGSGFDFARYDYAGSAVTAHLLFPHVNQGDAAGDGYQSIEGLVGSNFGDTLAGDNANNTIYGLNGNDTIYGLGGADLMYGGGGADIFAYVANSDSTPDARDYIGDFQSGSDKIDLSGLYSGGSDQLAIYDLGGGTYQVNHDQGGNGSVETAILVNGFIQASDIILGGAAPAMVGEPELLDEGSVPMDEPAGSMMFGAPEAFDIAAAWGGGAAAAAPFKLFAQLNLATDAEIAA